MKKVFVFGSLNMDLVIRASRMPLAGETMAGCGFMTNPGGKGANQAAACAKLGAQVRMAGCVGNDIFGAQMLKNLSGCGVDVSAVRTAENCSSGIAVITVVDGDNRIILEPGANACVSAGDADALLADARPGDIFITQLENPLPVVGYALHRAKQLGCFTILNPAPMDTGCAAFFSDVDLLTPNETELNALIGDCTSLVEAGKALRSMGVGAVAVTLGSKGYCYLSENTVVSEECIKTNVVDTTGAGDTFCGAAAAALAEGRSIIQALRFANVAASVAVSRPGAQQASPCREELCSFRF